MKSCVNKAYCHECERKIVPILNFDNEPACPDCGNHFLFHEDYESGNTSNFMPVFKTTKTYKVNDYCPELPDRRNSDRPWPLFREKRAEKRREMIGRRA